MTLYEYAASIGADCDDPTIVHAFEQKQREERRGKHQSTCSGYNERQCDCGQVDRIEAALLSLRESQANYRSALLAHRDLSIAEQRAYDEYIAALKLYNDARERTAEALKVLQRERAKMETEMMKEEAWR